MDGGYKVAGKTATADRASRVNNSPRLESPRVIEKGIS